MTELSARQVHLDFHTSPVIEGIGEKFDKNNFQHALKEGNVSSITIFAKCHHGYCYYPTEVGCMHPGLKSDLLGEMMDAAHEIGVKAPVYITAGLAAADAEKHPEWRSVRKDGSTVCSNYDFSCDPKDPRPECSWISLCLNDGSYAHHIYDLTREICSRYVQVDGLFYDICFMQETCYCLECIREMKKIGMNPEDEEDAKKYYVLKHQKFIKTCREILHEKHPDAGIFFNSGGADIYHPEYHGGSTHFEIEDLPTTWGGYDKMPLRAKFFGNTGKQYLGMTGKFHTDWGEFGGFKSKEALKYEAASMMAYGAKCSIGDQMHPSGKMDIDTYRNIGFAYRYAEEIEPFCLDSTSFARLGVYLSENEQSNEGIAKMLLESQIDFDIVYKDQFDAFDTVILPDCVKLTDSAVQKLNVYLARGGKLLFTGNSLIQNGEFQIDAGLHLDGDYGYEADYLTVKDALAEGVVKSPFLTYDPAVKVSVEKGEVLAEVMLPYFRRTYGTYCGHKNTPYNPADGGYPAAVQNGNILYLAHPVGKMYKKKGSIFHRRYFINALKRLYTEPLLEVQMPSSGRAVLRYQEEENRFCLHLLYAPPARRGEVEVIEDMPPLYNIPVRLRIQQDIGRICLGLSKEELPFRKRGCIIEFTVPYMQCHQIVVMEIFK